jgi:HemK-like putative methylase
MTQDEMWLLKEKYSGEKSEGFQVDVTRLQNGEPLAYIIGSIPFLNMTITLGSHPLIPRTETEFWVEKAIADMREQGEKPLRVLDLCAGSGCIGVAVLTALPHAVVDFVEIDTKHHATILKNIEINGIDVSRTRILGGSLFEQVSDTYDYILSNPPYVDKSLGRVAPEVQSFEPALALYGGTDGTEMLAEIIAKASAFLTSEGVLYLEHEPEQTELLATLTKSHGFRGVTLLDQFDILRYTRLARTPS